MIISIVFLVIILIVVSVRRIYSGALRIVVAPTSASIVIDGKKYENGSYEGVRAGIVHVDITAEGFEPESFDLNIAPDVITGIYSCLKTDDSNLLQEGDYAETCSLVKEYYGEKEKDEFSQRYPISNVIPVVVEEYSWDYTSYTYYRIDFGKYKDCEREEYCVKITDFSGGNYDNAIKMIRKKGYNPNDYEIIYEDSSKWGHA